ncbi:MAG: hypothetical protein HOD58_12265 [Gammaproteobacteria bacterium]|jgi:hypothetical protein|nr:hypothetical protein [Candidatus Neomarinimicrobiota bacterium]MBT4330690.1 hypothetical protein [Gammaproteobacteria bacterium]
MNVPQLLKLEAQTTESEQRIMDRAIEREHEVLSRMAKIRPYAMVRDDLAVEYNALAKERGLLTQVIEHAKFNINELPKMVA